MSSFNQFDLHPSIARALQTIKYTTPTAIQQGAIPPALQGRDILGCAQTGTGKTASFALPILHRLNASKPGSVRALVLAPTRELAVQIHESFQAYGQNLRLRSGILIGGVNMKPQESMLKRGVDILVATPGRLKDHLMRGTCCLDNVQILVLDEADRMLDMGFIRDIRAILKGVPPDRQTLFFSATLPAEIQKLSREMLRKPVIVEVAAVSSTPRSVRQVLHNVPQSAKKQALLHLLGDETMTQVIVFSRTKHGANKLTEYLNKHGHNAVVIHGNKSQNQRQASLTRFKEGKARLLIATDIAARGLDIAGVSHVVNFDAPQAPEDYVHRIGRTGRAQAVGVAISLVGENDVAMIRSIERLTGTKIARETLHGFKPEVRPASPEPRQTRGPRGRDGYADDTRSSDTRSRDGRAPRGRTPQSDETRGARDPRGPRGPQPPRGPKGPRGPRGEQPRRRHRAA